MITDELRRWVGIYEHEVNYMLTSRHATQLLEIADRIDIAHKHVIGYVDDRDPETMAEHGWVRLPVDAEGEYTHVGDVMETDNGIREVDVLQKSSRKWSVGLVPVGGGAFSWHDAETLRHHHAPTVEDVLREFAENITDSQIPNVHPTYEEAIAEYASKLRLAGEDA